MVVATQNPIEQEGTYALPEAQLDRFLVKVLIGYPSLEDERRMVAEVVDGKLAADLDVSQVQPVVDQAGLLAMQRGVAAIRMDAAVTDYAVRIVRATREWPGVIGGAGPRGGLALARWHGRAPRSTAATSWCPTTCARWCCPPCAIACCWRQRPCWNASARTTCWRRCCTRWSRRGNE